MAIILHIETTTPTCSVAVSEDQKVLSVKESHVDKSHAALLTTFISEVLEQAKIKPVQLDAISVSKGPGSYTGLRIGVSTAKGLAYGLNKPLLAVPTLDALALGFYNSVKQETQPFFLCPMIDARRLEVYTALFDSKMICLKEANAQIIDNKSFSAFLKKGVIYFFGTGAQKCQSLILHGNAVFAPDFHCSATFLVSPALSLYENKKFEDVAYFEPFYLKDFVATVPKNKVLGTKGPTV